MANVTAERVRQRSVEWANPSDALARAALMSGREWLLAIHDGALPVPPAAALIGVEIERVDDDEVVFSLEASEFQYNPMGTVHGGVLTTLADSAMTSAVIAKLPAGARATTVEIKINFVRAVTEATGRIYATGKLIHLGNTTGVAEAHVVDADGRLLAHATTTCAIQRGAQ